MARIELVRTKRTDEHLLARMAIHYSQPRGFVGRNICYAVMLDGEYHGHIVGGSTPKHLPGRDRFPAATLNERVNNLFFNISGPYPFRNAVQKVIRVFRETIAVDWPEQYGDKVIVFETLVELPRVGECYRRDGWLEVGQTKGFTCKREAGKGTDSWTGRRVWNTDPTQLRPKRVFMRSAAQITPHPVPNEHHGTLDPRGVPQ